MLAVPRGNRISGEATPGVLGQLVFRGESRSPLECMREEEKRGKGGGERRSGS
jgi:hypothetical protein